MEKERFFHECPECGLLSPWIQQKCDCGYKFNRKFLPNRLSITVIVILSTLLTASIIVISLLLSNVVSPIKHQAASPDATKSPYTVSASLPTPTIRPSPTPRPVPISNGAIVKDTRLEKLAPLTVKTFGILNYYVFLKCRATFGGVLALPGSGDISFYVSAGQSVDILVPLGSYDLYYATGGVWYGPDLKFGASTRYYKCEDSFWFAESSSGYSGWTVTLHTVSGGNMETKPVSSDEFPE